MSNMTDDEFVIEFIINVPKKRGVARLLKLAKFLRTLPESHFDFGIVLEQHSKTRENKCGTIGCAIGWCPVVFPRLVEITPRMFMPTYRLKRGDKQCRGDFRTVGQHLFGMPLTHVERLFVPEKHSPADGRRLGYTTTPTKVAQRVETYAKWWVKQK